MTPIAGREKVGQVRQGERRKRGETGREKRKEGETGRDGEGNLRLDREGERKVREDRGGGRKVRQEGGTNVSDEEASGSTGKMMYVWRSQKGRDV